MAKAVQKVRVLYVLGVDLDQLQRQVQDAAPTVIDNFDNVLVKRKVNGVEEMVSSAA